MMSRGELEMGGRQSTARDDQHAPRAARSLLPARRPGQSVGAGREAPARRTLVALAGLAVCTLAGHTGLFAAPSQCGSGTTERVSVSSSGVQGSGTSSNGSGSLCASGRFAVFSSEAPNLVPGDTNLKMDVFVRDRLAGQTARVSVSSSGGQGNDISSGGYITPDGRYIGFGSAAWNLVGGDTNWMDDVFVHNRQTGETVRVSVGSGGAQGNGGSYGGLLSADGRFVVFSSYATNLVPRDTNGYWDIFVHDRESGETRRVSVSSGEDEANGHCGDPVITADGRYVAFGSAASNLVPGDTNGYWDVFVHDRQTGVTTRVSVDSAGLQGNGVSSHPSIGADGRFVAFESSASDLVPGDTNNKLDVFVHDRHTGETTRVSVTSTGMQGDSHSRWPWISADGLRVAFESYASNLVAGDTNGATDAFVHDRQTGETWRASVSSAGVQGNSISDRVAISADGRCVSFASYADNLVPGDTNWKKDVFVRDCGPPSVPLAYCIAQTNSLGCTGAIGFSGTPSATAGSGFDVAATNVFSHKSGLLFYGLRGSTLVPFQGGWLCVRPPLRRTPVQSSGGALPPPSRDCTGAFSFDFNAWIGSAADPALVAGQEVWAQYWSRDPGYPPPYGSNLTDALAFAIQP